MSRRPTCVFPEMWSLGEATVALCERARVTRREECARFNWVLLIATPDAGAAELARRYWRAVARDLADTDAVGPELLTLTAEAASRASAAHTAGDLMRRELNGRLA